VSIGEKAGATLARAARQAPVLGQDHALSHDVEELRHTLRDLVAVSTLPAIWMGYDAGQVAASVTDVLVDMLGLDFAYLWLRLPGDAPAIDLARAAALGSAEATPILRQALADRLGKRVPEEVVVLPDPFGKGRLRALFAPVGGDDTALLVIGSRRADFPSTAQRLLVGVCASQTAIAIGRWRAEQELYRLNDTLEQRVASEIKARLTAEEAFRQAQKMEAIGQLTGGIAHDFNNILTAIFGSLEMVLGSDEPDEKTRRMVNTALRSAGRGARLTQQLLAFSRRQVLQPKRVNLNELLSEMRVLIQRAVGEAIEISLALAPELPACVIDPAQFETAVLNLVINARDAMANGGRLRIATRKVTIAADTGELARGDYVVLSVADSGAGMSAEVRARAFEPFFTTKEVGKGSGLGLSMVYGFARQSAGTAVIDSTPKRGTSVQLYLPALTGAAEPEDERDSAVVASGTGTILLVEDNEEVRSATAEVLGALGYEVVAASDGRTALEQLHRRDAIDLVLTDLIMPRGMSGIDLLRAVRRLSADLPVLLMSGYSPALSEETSGELHCAFIAKPFRPAELGKAINDLLRGVAAKVPTAGK
jgi:signal transduction histidine kinase/ActR/RegA family two-component response regulator